MTELNIILSKNFGSLAEAMAYVINDKFKKVQELCSNLNPEKDDYYVYLFNDRDDLVFASELHQEYGEWHIHFKYEYGCRYNELPCDNYKDSIIGMTVEEIQKVFSASSIRIISTSSNKSWDEIENIKL